MKTSADLANEIDALLKHKLGLQQAHQVIKQERLSVSYEIAKLRVKSKELEQMEAKSSFNLEQIRTKEKILNEQFWTAKNSGL